MSWDIIKFSNLYSVESRNGLTKPSKIRGSGYKMINMGELFSYDRIYDIPMELVPLTDREKNSSRIETGDLLFARQSLVLEGAGKCSIVMEASDLTVFESHLIRVRLNKEIANPLFYYYYFKSSLSPIKSIVSQCAQSGIRGSDLGELGIAFPDISIQNRIATILSTYDDLIENNQKQIKLLEEAAQRLYKEWFVDLRFPGCENTPIIDGVPQGWKKSAINDIAEYINGYAFKPSDWGENGKPIIKIKEMGEGVTKDTPRNSGTEIPKKYHIYAGDILFSWSATLSAMIWDGEDGLLNQHLFKVVPLDNFSREYVLQSILYTLGEFQNLTTGATMKHIQRGKLKEVFVNTPGKNIMHQYEVLAEPIRTKILSLKKQNLNLIEARDRLLPKLMSGEIDLTEKKKVEILQPLPKLSYDDFLSDLGMAARAKAVSEADLRAMYEAYLDDDAEDRD